MEEFRRILLVDDNKDIHEDFHKILDSSENTGTQLTELEGILFNEKTGPEKAKNHIPESFTIQLDDAYQGDEAVLKVEAAAKENNPYILIFMDVRMPPGMDGIETIYKIWRKYPLIEIVICSAYSDYSWNEILDKLGASDKLLFLKKPFNAVELKQITFSLVKKWNINYKVQCLVNNLKKEISQRTEQLDQVLIELRDKNRELLEVSRQDGITGLLNHVALYEQLNALYSASRRHEYPFVVFMIDIDDFGKFNTHCGHTAGDKVLKEISLILTGTLRLYDVALRCKDDGSEILKKEMERFNLAGRYGGDEFILIIPYCDREGALTMAGRIQEKVKAIRLEDCPELNLTVSIGIAVQEKDRHCPDCNALITLVDKALSISRAKGKNQISCLTYEA